MGHPVLEEEPSYGECPDCCNAHSCGLNCKFTAPGIPSFYGKLEQSELFPCQYIGLLQGGFDGAIPVYLTFCADGADANIICGPPLAGPCGGAIIADNHCNPFIDVTTPAGCRYEVWP